MTTAATPTLPRLPRRVLATLRTRPTPVEVDDEGAEERAEVEARSRWDVEWDERGWDEP